MADVDNDIQINDEEIVETKPQSFKDLNLDELLEKHADDDKKAEDKEEEEVKEEVKEETKEEVKEELTKEEQDIKEAEAEIEGYYADEGIEEEEIPEVETSAQTPQEQLAKYILDGLQPIQITGVSNGKNVNMSIRVADELPDDFQFNSVKDEARFNQAIAAQAITARNLADKYLADQQQVENQRYTAQERRDIAADIAKLQRAGELQTFTPGVNVDEDPRAETARQVMRFYEDENRRRLETANTGQRLYHPLSYEDAYYLWKQRQGTVNSEQKQEDAERKEITQRSSKAGRGASVEGGQKRTGLPSTASWDQVINEALKLY